jgi:hypothetical protein
MILKGCWYFLVLMFFATVAVYFFGNAAGWVVGLFALSFVGAIVYKVLTAGKADAAALAVQQVRVARKFNNVLPLDLVEEAKSAPQLVPEGSGDGWAIDTDGYTQVPRSDEPLELTLIAQSAANVGTNTVLVALGQLVIGKVKSDQLEELYQAVMSTGGVARCLGTVSEIDVAKPFGVIKGQ